MTAAVLRSAADLRDGEWFRLHPLTPLLQGGVVLVGLLGAGFAALWETVILRSILQFVGQGERISTRVNPIFFFCISKAF